MLDLLLTDPPYGVKATLNSTTAKRAPWSISGSRRKNDYGLSFDDSVEYVCDIVVPIFTLTLARSKRGIVTPGNRCLTLYPMPDSFGSFWQPASTGLQRWGRCDSQPISTKARFLEIPTHPRNDAFAQTDRITRAKRPSLP